ncbi:MAG: penicillin-binding protein 2 [Sphingomonadaceae bacterium]|nr:penicillin-binding protein 2 [Sphingomonadaceae bacterium]
MTAVVLAPRLRPGAPPLADDAPRPWTAPLARMPVPPVPASLEDARRRAGAALVLLLLAVASIIARLAYLALFDRPTRPVPATQIARGTIVDRNGLVLAQGYKAFALTVHPDRVISDRAALAPKLAAVLSIPPADAARLLQPPGKFRYLARRVPPSIAAAAIALGEPAIEVQREPDRVYPNGELGAHVLGFVNRDGEGGGAIERAFEDDLADGKNVSLTIDSRVQQALESELAAGMAKHSAIGAAGVVMDVETGEVLALASLPAFNPNLSSFDPTDNARMNRATYGRYELGSCFKAMTVAMALDTGVTNLQQMLDARHPLQIGRFKIHDDHAKSRFLSVPETFIYSSNIATARLAEALGPDRQRDYLKKLGFMDRVQLEYSKDELRTPQYPSRWGRIETMTVGYGHGIAVTPLHLATAYASVVNGGLWRPATIVRGIARPEPVRVFKPETSEAMRRLFRLVVLSGTGRKADAPGYRVGGKTGTAEKPQAGRYNHKALISTFAGAFPMDNPRYVVVAMLDEPRGTKDTFGFATAGWVSAPIVRNVILRAGPMLGVQADTARDVDVNGLLPADAKAEE